MSVLGICLGAQLLATALGGKVSRNAVREIGWYDVELTDDGTQDPVLSAFEATQEVFQWHEDGIELPPDAVNLATSSASAVQAFRFGEHAYGFQFHLEVDARLVERWLTVPANQSMLKDEGENVDPDEIRRATEHSIGPLEDLSRNVFSRWIERFDLEPKKMALPSR